MVEYKLMNRNELTNFIFNFWNNWGAFNYEERLDEEIKAEIWENLNSNDGIQKELDYIRQEFEAGWEQDSLEYERLDELWNYINWYLTDFGKKKEE